MPNSQDSDTTAERQDDYTNLDLETAEGLLYAAGKPELAKALHHHAHGVRNLVQGEWGQSFANSLEGILERHIGPLTEQIGGLRGATTALQAEFHTGLSGIQETVSTLVETVDDLQTQMRESQGDRQSIHEELAAVKADVAALQQQFTGYMAGSKRGEIDTLKTQLAELRGEYSPEERARLTGILLRMIAEWEATHGDGNR